MKKFLLLIFIFSLTFSTISAQPATSPVPEMDRTIKILAEDLNKKLNEAGAKEITIGQFTSRGSITQFSEYWANQLSQELINVANKSFNVVMPGYRRAEWTISGEIVEVAGLIRVYTRLIHSERMIIEASLVSDVTRNSTVAEMLYSEGSRDERSSYVSRDGWEPDSFENPVFYEIGVNERIPVMNRTLHGRGEDDYFLLVPAENGTIVIETTGSVDTVMILYDAETMEQLDEDDDSGNDYNASITYNVSSGRRYIVKVRGYSGDSIGNYGFRAYARVP